MEFRKCQPLESLVPGDIVRIPESANRLIGVVQGISQKYYGVWLVRIPREKSSRRYSAESLEILVQDGA